VTDLLRGDYMPAACDLSRAPLAIIAAIGAAAVRSIKPQPPAAESCIGPSCWPASSPKHSRRIGRIFSWFGEQRKPPNCL
jgi:hypothetical protein